MMHILLVTIVAIMWPQTLCSDQNICGKNALCDCNPSFTDIDCSLRNLSFVPSPLPQSVQKLILDKNQISEIEDGAFLWNYNLNRVSMSFNRLRRIRNNTFTSCYQLEHIYLDGNKIIAIEAGAFPSNCSITNIQLQNNNLQRIPLEAISRCTSLKSLYLNNNHIHKIEDDSFLNNPEIRYLTLQSNDLSSLPPFMYRPIKHANQVFLSTNQINEVLTSSFRGLITVKCFALNGNNITRLPADLFRDFLIKETLDLSENHLEEIPDNLFARHFDGRYHYMKMLILHKNKLRFLRRNTFEGLYKLKHLFLNSNQLQVLENGAFIGSSVRFIYLFGNNLINMPNNSFDNGNITQVQLYKNPIQNLSKNALDGFKDNTTLLIKDLKLNGDLMKRSAALWQLTIKTYDSFRAFIFISCKKSDKVTKIQKRRKHLCEELTLHTIYVVRVSDCAASTVCGACVTSDHVPPIIADKQFLKLLTKEGFNCTRFQPGKKGSFHCEPCRPGTFGDAETGCIPCPPGGYYQDEVGQTALAAEGMACKECNNGTFVKSGWGISLSACQVCPEGTNQTLHAGFRACPCKSEYTRTDRFGECLYCFEEGLNCSLDYKFLLPGYYWNWSFADADIKEYKGFVSNLRNETRFYDPSTTRYTKSVPRAHLCPRPESCANKDGHMVDKLAGTCESGYTGWLCSKCKRGYYAILDNCKLCPNKFWLYLEIFIVMCICLALYFFVKWQIKHDSKLSGNQRTLIDKISSRMKILLGFYQVVGELFESLHGLKWRYPFRLLGEFTTYVKLNVLRLFFRPQCFNKHFEINPLLRFKIRLCLPVAFIIICFLLYQTRKGYIIYRYRGNAKVKDKILKSFKATLYTYTLLFLFITYPPICDAIFSLYPGACQKFFFDKNETHSIRLLRSDFDINCDNLAVYHTLAFVATTLYVIAFPCVLLLLLLKYHKSKTNDKKPGKSTHPFTTNDDAIESETRPLLDVRHAKNGAVPIWLKFLCENYKSGFGFWFWEIVELVRKIAQTAMVTLLGWENDLTIFMTIGAAVSFLCLHARYLPMKNTFEQRLQLFSLTAIFINVMAKAMPTRQGTTMQIGVILLNVTIGLVVLAEAVVGIVFYIRKKIMFHGQKSQK